MARKRQPKVAIVILTYSQDKLLELCLKSIRKTAGYKEYQIFLVDNNSKNKIGNVIEKKFSEVRVIVNEENYGFSKGNNIGIDTAKREYNPDYFLVLNDDVEFFQEDWLKRLVLISEREKFGVAGCKLLYPDKRMQNAGGFLKGWRITKTMAIGKKEVKKVDHIMGAFMFVKREVMDKLGGFDEDFSPYLLEDTDFCLRAKKSKFNIVSLGEIETIHHAHQSLSKSKDPKLFFRFKNDILFSWRHLSFWNSLFRIFIYLPAVAVLKKESDESDLRPRNFKLRKGFIFGIWYLLKAYLFIARGQKGIQIKNEKNK